MTNTTTTAKLNRAGQSHGGFYYSPFSVMSLKTVRNGRERKLTPWERVIASAIYSLSKDGRIAEFTLKEISDRYNMSRSSAYRGVKTVRDGELVERKEKVFEYEFTGDVSDDRKLYFEDWLYHAEFCINGKIRCLIPNEVSVLSYIISFLDEDFGEPDDPWEMSRQYIARGLNISADTVSRIVDTLKAAKLIYIKKGRKVKNRCIFGVKGSVLRKARKSTIKRAKKANSAASNTGQEADERADRESCFSRRKNAAEWKAEQMNDLARSDEAYRTASDELRKLDIEISNAEVRGLPTLPVLIERQRAAQARRAARLAAMGISEESLIPQYTCKKCSDSGFLPNGRACDCYPIRGAP